MEKRHQLCISLSEYKEKKGGALRNHLGATKIIYKGLPCFFTIRILGGTMIISSVLCWKSIQIGCIYTKLEMSLEHLKPSSGFKFHPRSEKSIPAYWIKAFG
jgi:hypothetical protein